MCIIKCIIISHLEKVPCITPEPHSLCCPFPGIWLLESDWRAQFLITFPSPLSEWIQVMQIKWHVFSMLKFFILSQWQILFMVFSLEFCRYLWAATSYTSAVNLPWMWRLPFVRCVFLTGKTRYSTSIFCSQSYNCSFTNRDKLCARLKCCQVTSDLGIFKASG